MYGIIYKIINNINGKIYIGKTTGSISRRFKQHLAGAKDNQPRHANLYLYNAIRKYGADKFSAEKLDEACSLEELNNKEQYWIKALHTYIDDPECNGYNMTIGGDGGNGWCQETKDRWYNTRLTNGSFKLKEETKQKLSKALTGKSKSESHKQSLRDHHHLKTTHILYFKDGHTELTTDSVETIAKERLHTTKIKLQRASEVGSFRLGDFYLLDITDLDRAFKLSLQFCKDNILIDPITNLPISVTGLRHKFQAHPELYNNIFPNWIFNSEYQIKYTEFINKMELIKRNALNKKVE